MRIICPNCDAQYEVPDEVIPPEGRDVQCSNCNTTWMQEHPDHPGAARAREAENDAAREGADTDSESAEPGADAAPEADASEERPDAKPAEPDLQPEEDAAQRDAQADAAEDDEREGTAETTPPEERDTQPPADAVESKDETDEDRTEDEREDAEQPAAPPRRELDPEVEAILREEAERETAARAAETRGDGLEVQPELGLPEGDAAASRPTASAPDTRSGDGARTSGATADGGTTTGAGAAGATVAGAAAASSRRDLLPDIEEINSTLRSTGDRDAAGDDPDPEAAGRVRRRRGFRRGLLTALLIFVVALLTYQYAPQIAAQVPQADPWLSGYVTWVDETRLTLDQQLRTMLGWLDDQAGSSE